MPISKNDKKNNESGVFEVLQYLGLEPSKAGELLIEDLANERVNAVEWEKLSSNSNTFNDFLKANKRFWEILYSLSKKSLKGDYPALVILKETKQIIPCEIISIVRSAITDKIFNVIVLVDIIHWKESSWKVTWEFTSEMTEVKTSLDLINKADSRKDITEEAKEKFLEVEKYKFPLKIDKDNIPVVEWRSLPNNMTFYEQALEKAKTLSVANDIYVDQLVNAMTKRVDIDTSQTTGGPEKAEQTNTKKLIFSPISYVKSTTLDEFDKIQAMYQPPATNIKEFRDNIDWLELKIKTAGKSLKDDDQDSAQKSEIELININRSAMDGLEVNLAMWITSLEEVIKIYDKKDGEIKVDLQLRTVGKMIKQTAEAIGINVNPNSTPKEVKNGTEDN